VLGQTFAELFYNGAGRSLKALAALCQGLLNSDGTGLVDPSALPWSTVKRPSNIKQTR